MARASFTVLTGTRMSLSVYTPIWKDALALVIVEHAAC